jgi:hypothetical protein
LQIFTKNNFFQKIILVFYDEKFQKFQNIFIKFVKFVKFIIFSLMVLTLPTPPALDELAPSMKK